MDGVGTECRRGLRSSGRWHTGASDLFNDTHVGTIFFNDIQIKASCCGAQRGTCREAPVGAPIPGKDNGNAGYLPVEFDFDRSGRALAR
jgi:hypothetical protein